MKSLFEYWTDGVVLTSIAIFGIFGTFLALRVLQKKDLKGSFSMLLSGLAVSDVCFLFFTMVTIGLPTCSEW